MTFTGLASSYLAFELLPYYDTYKFIAEYYL